MNQLPPNIPFPTPEGVLMLPDWLGPWLPATQDDLRALRRHMLIVGIDADTWKQWADELGVEKVYDVKTLATFFHLWLKVCRLAAEKGCDIAPQDEFGYLVYEQHFAKFKNALEPKPEFAIV